MHKRQRTNKKKNDDNNTNNNGHKKKRGCADESRKATSKVRRTIKPRDLAPKRNRGRLAFLGESYASGAGSLGGPL